MASKCEFLCLHYYYFVNWLTALGHFVIFCNHSLYRIAGNFRGQADLHEILT